MRSRHTNNLSIGGVAEKPGLIPNQSRRIGRGTTAKKDGTSKWRVEVLLDIADHERGCE